MSGSIVFLRKPYFTFKQFYDLAICGKRVNIPYGSTLLLSPSEKMLTFNGDAITLPFSENGVTHFCRNDDGCGPERGRIIMASRAALPMLTEAQVTTARKEWPHFFFPYSDVLLFDNPFYDADIDDLRAFVATVGISIRRA